MSAFTAMPEPLVLTLEEALVELSKTIRGLAWRDTEWESRWEVRSARGYIAAVAATWPEAVSISLGHPVVARNELAEVRTALGLLVEAIEHKWPPAMNGFLLGAPHEIKRAVLAAQRILHPDAYFGEGANDVPV